MDLQTRVKAREGVMSTEVDGQAVLMHVEQGIYYGLNDVGALIWRHMAASIHLRDLRDAVLSEFDVAPDDCERDVINLIEQLENAKLVEIVAAKV
jgi:hypothetical protein